MATDEQIATAFNAAYTMQQIDPAMIQKLLATDNKESEIVQAMHNGARKSQLDKITQQQQNIKDKLQQKKRGR